MLCERLCRQAPWSPLHRLALRHALYRHAPEPKQVAILPGDDGATVCTAKKRQAFRLLQPSSLSVEGENTTNIYANFPAATRHLTWTRINVTDIGRPANRA
jgi:hypothetical protein